MQKQHFLALEWLRFGLGTYIVLFHTFHFPELGSWANKITQLGFFATSTFFVLSGFLLSHVYLNRHADHSVSMRESTKSFLIKRFANLYPIHIISLLVTLCVVSALPYFAINPDDAGASLRFILFDRNDYADALSLRHYMSDGELVVAFFMNFTLLHALNPYYLTFNAPAWTISTLFCLYLLFPILAVRLNRIKRPLLGIVVLNLIYLVPVFATMYFIGFGAPETGVLHRNPLIRIPEFASGILLCSLYHRQMANGFKLKKQVIGLLVLLIAGSLIGASQFLEMAPLLSQKGNAAYFLLHDGLLLPAQVALIYLCLHIKLPEGHRFVRFSRLLGGASLPMFAFHVPFWTLFSRTQKVLSGKPQQCLESIKNCGVAAGELQLMYYPMFFLMLVCFCIVFQERIVVSCRKRIISLLLTPKIKLISIPQ